MKSICSVVLLGACLAVPTVASGAAPSEVHPSSPTPASAYRSAFADYRPFQDEPITDWRALNEGVAQAGGHVGIMRDASSSASTHPSTRQSAGPVSSGPTRAPDAHRH